MESQQMRTAMHSNRRIAMLACLASCGGVAFAQAAKPLATVSIAEADVSNGAGGIVTVAAGRATLSGNSTVTALNRNATIDLTRGGSVLLCQTSSLHVTSGGEEPALLLALDRGALELRAQASTNDLVMTPDLRFAPTSDGPLELNLRVEPNGDTCVDNHGKHAPTLNIVDAFGESTYLLKPGQHVTFEHGSLRQVIDRETTPCGCPPQLKPVPLADALLQGRPGKISPAQAAAAYPFPEAQSAGLAPAPPREPETPGQVHVQVATTLGFDPDAPRQPQAANPDDAAATLSTSAPPAPAHKRRGVFGSVGHFFKSIFVR
jgi:hypothetical protein